MRVNNRFKTMQSTLLSVFEHLLKTQSDLNRSSYFQFSGRKSFYFNLLIFGESFEFLFDRSKPLVSQKTVDSVLQAIDKPRANKRGTKLVEPLKAAFGLP